MCLLISTIYSLINLLPFHMEIVQHSNNEHCIEKLSDFAYVKDYIDEGRLLVICGQEYKAWYYDTYIFDAIDLASKWKPHQVTYRRISYLRDWIRENIQHAHNFPTDNLKSMRSVKLWIDDLIRREYGWDDCWKEEEKYALKVNAEVFKSNNLQS